MSESRIPERHCKNRSHPTPKKASALPKSQSGCRSESAADKERKVFAVLLAFDIGNTNITLGCYEGDRLAVTARLSSDIRRTDDQYAADIFTILSLHGITTDERDDSIICSVVPALSRSVGEAVKHLIGKPPVVIGPGVKTGLNIKIDNPAQLGADLVAGAVGAAAKYPLPSVIIDLGTASTISVLSANGEFLGGAIAAGVNSTLRALTSNTALLSDTGLERPEHVIGTNTAESMQSGLVVGAAAMIDGLIDRMEEELGEPFASVIATGGLAGEVIPCCRRSVITDDRLLLDGLRIIYNKNR